MAFMSDKYPRILHFPWSPGAKNDDRIAGPECWSNIKYKRLIFTEKMDGSNSAITKEGVFARTRAVLSKNPWDSYLWQIQATILPDLGDMEVFVENMYAVHSIEYTKLWSYFYMFGVRENGIWKSWEDTKFIAAYFKFEMVPEYATPFEELRDVKDERKFEVVVKKMAEQSFFGNTCEGVVVRDTDEFADRDDSTFGYNILKYVRKDHVQTDEHWTTNWKKAKIITS